MEQPSYTGSCLCKAVRFEFRAPTAFRYCHCERCRKATGSAHAANLFVPASQFAWLAGEDRITRYALPQAQRFSVWFCRDCGSRVPHRIPTREDFLVPAGAVDTPLMERPTDNIFWASRAQWCVAAVDLPTHDGYPK